MGIRFYLFAKKRTKRPFRGMRCQLVLEIWPPSLYWSLVIWMFAKSIVSNDSCGGTNSLSLQIIFANRSAVTSSGLIFLSGLIWILKLFDKPCMVVSAGCTCIHIPSFLLKSIKNRQTTACKRIYTCTAHAV